MNAVLVRGVNDDEVEAFAEFAREKDIVMRFIEFMPLDADREWTRDKVVTAAEIHRRISARWQLIPVVHERSETARKYRFVDGGGEIGLIAPVTQPFCGHCSRIRLTADGKLRTCLFSKEDHDLKSFFAVAWATAKSAMRLWPWWRRKKRATGLMSRISFRPRARWFILAADCRQGLVAAQHGG